MKRSILALFFILLIFNAFAQTNWTVETVPNTRLQGNEIHVSDPDGYLSDSVETTINTALGAIRDTVDVFVVTLTSIGDAEPKRFATKLFNYWGIGDTEKDNGVLLLFVEDQHALEFETGYGAEATLTDAKCERIFTKTIVPYFRNGDYEGGLSAGVTEIVSVYGGEIPDGLMNFLPKTTDNSGDTLGGDDIGVFTMIIFLLMFIMPIVGLVYWVKKRNEKTVKANASKLTTEDGVIYLEGSKTSWSGSPWEGKGCLGALMLGFSPLLFFFVAFVFIALTYPDMTEKSQFNWAAMTSLVLYLTWICFRQNHRALKMADTLAKQSLNPKSVYKAAIDHRANKAATWIAPWLGWVYHQTFKKRWAQSGECQCPTCHAKMKRDNDFNIPEVHAFENKIGAMSYKPYRCLNGHTIVLKDKGNRYSRYSTCEKCGAYTLMKTHTKTIKEANYSHNGERLETYECQHCGHSFTKTVVIPMLVHYSSSSSSSYSSSSSSRSYSGHSSGGSFGGGHSGGGGYSGRW